MGIKERQERGREAVRSSILDAARELFVTDGFEQVSIRKIAERIEYSPAAIYGYFPSKDDIFVDRSVPRIGREYERFTFAREGKQILTARIEEAVRAGVLPASIAPEVMVHIVSCALVGVAAMRLSDRLPNGNVADALARDVLNVTLAGLQTAPQTFFSSPACPLDETSPFLPDAHVSSQEPRS